MADAADPKTSGSEDWTKGLTEDPKTDPKQEPVPEDHPSKLGRKVQRLEETQGQLLSALEEMKEMLRSRPAPTPRREEVEEDPVEAAIISKAVKKTREELTREQSEEADSRRRYVQSYARTIKQGFGEEDVDLHDEVVKELLEVNYNDYPVHTRNPEQDARINYDRALAKVLRRQRLVSQDAPNVKGDKNKAPTGLSSGSQNPAEAKPKIEADEFSSKFLRSLGVSPDEEWVQESLRNAK